MLVSDGSVPSELLAERETMLGQVGLPAFCVLIGENGRVGYHANNNRDYSFDLYAE